jgi:hypothetical protein
MSDTFDPYVQWLGIRDPQRPPNHYRLLGVDLFEGDPEVLTNAADRQMAHVRNFQTGKRSAVSQKLLNELASAKICLLSPQKKADYDARIRAEQTAAVAPEMAVPTAAAPSPGGPEGWHTPPQDRPPISGASLPPSLNCEPAPPAVLGDSAGWPAGEDSPLADLGAGYRATPGTPTSWVSLAIAVLSSLVVVLVGLIVFVSQRGPARDPQPKVAVTVIKPAAAEPVLSAEIDETPRKAEREKGKAEAGAGTGTLPSATPSTVAATPAPPAPAATKDTIGKPGTPAGPVAAPTLTTATPAVAPAAAPPATAATPVAAAPQSTTAAPSSAGAPSETIVKLAVPDEAALGKAREGIRQLLSKEFAAAEKPEQKSKLAAFLLKQAVETKDDMAARYELFWGARQQAKDAVDLDLYMEILEKTAEHYVIDPLAAKAEDLRQAVKRPRYNAALVKALLSVAEEMIGDDRYDEADALAETAREAALRNKDTLHSKEAGALRRDVKQMRQLHNESEQSQKILAEHPDDPAANMVLGKYMAFGKHNWDRGLSLLAKGDNETLKALADAEKTTPASAAQMAVLGDQWWDAAATGHFVDIQRFMQARAAFWYRRALPELSGLTKTRTQRRLTEFGR